MNISPLQKARYEYKEKSNSPRYAHIYRYIYANLRKGSSSLTVNEFPRFISENDKHLRVLFDICVQIYKKYRKKIPPQYFSRKFYWARTIAITKIGKNGILQIVFCCLSTTILLPRIGQIWLLSL